MTRVHSTGKLSLEQKQQQESIYQAAQSYDYVIIGTGMAALTVGALLANAGAKICLLEAHDIPGGYAHTFEMNGFHFCAQVHYIWGCAPGERIFEFLKMIGLEREVTFESYDRHGYDHVSLPDGNRVLIPNGLDRLVENITAVYPDQGKHLWKFLNVLTKISQEIAHIPHGGSWWKYVLKAPQFLTTIRYRNSTLQQLFDACHLRKEVQAIFSAISGDFMAPPEELSLIAFALLFTGYNAGAYYPTHHYKQFVEAIATFILRHAGCNIYYETTATRIDTAQSQVTAVHTADGKCFKAGNFICNMDPQQASYMIGRDKFPSTYLPALSYEYSPASFIMYLGLKEIDLLQYGFGNFNIWHMSQWDMNKTWQDLRQNNFDHPWIALSTPTLHTQAHGAAPEGCHILELTTAASYDWFKHLRDTNPKRYRAEKRQLADRLLDIVEQHYIPTLRKHIALKVVGTPTTNEEFCLACRGNSYGAHVTPANMGLKRLKANTPWNNFFWCNATSGYGGIYGTVYTGMQLYSHLC